MAHIIPFDQIREFGENLHTTHKKIVLAGGCFDILHLGHLTFLEKAKKEGDFLVILLESDETIEKTKGANRPIHTQEERAYMLSQISSVDAIIMLPSTMENDQYDSLVKSLQPAIIAATEGDPNIFHKERQAKIVGAQVKIVTKLIPSVSTSRIVQILSQEQ